MSGGELAVSIVMPCLNEQATVSECVAEARRFGESCGRSYEIVVADNGSTDRSREMIVEAGARLVEVSSRGYGCALRGGIEAARGRFVIMADSDLSYSFEDARAILDRLEAGADLVVGNRFRGAIEKGAMPALHRYLGTPVLSFVIRLFTRSPLGDVNCGLRGFSRSAYERMRLRAEGMELASEMIIRAAVAGLKVEEVPVELRRDGRDRPPHLRAWRDGWRHLRLLLLSSPDWLFIYPGLLAIAIGLALSLVLKRDTLMVLGIGFDVQTLLYAALLILVGFKSLIFGIFTKVLAIRSGYLPPDRATSLVQRALTLELGLVCGIALMLFGFWGSVSALAAWGRADFGALEVRATLRTVIPAILAIAIGCEVVLASFFLSILKLEGISPGSEPAA